MENGNLLASNVDYLKDALSVLDELKRAKGEREQLQDNLKELERDMAGEEKAARDEVELTVKKRKEEISASFDREIRKDQDRVRRVRLDREKAKDKSVAERIESETADLREENRKTLDEIHAVLKENHLPRLCNTKIYFGIFFPKGIIEYLIFMLAFIILNFALPFGIVFFMPEPAKKPITMLIVCFLCYFLFFLSYQLIVKKTKMEKWQAVYQVRALRDKIRANIRKIKVIRNLILKDKNEQGYNLEKFDTTIAELEAEVKRSMAEKQDALTAFEETTKYMLIEEINGRHQEKISLLQAKQEETNKDLKEADILVKDINKHITANYEAFLGKDYVTEKALQDMIVLMEEQGASTVAEALALYKAEH